MSLVVRESDWRMNGFDEFAVEEALRIREAVPGSLVDAVSVGPARVAAVLRRALAMGADEGIHILYEEPLEPFPGVVAELAEMPDVTVAGFEGNALAFYNGEARRHVLAPILAKMRPRFICVGHDSTGADFAPGLAVRLGAGCITVVENARFAVCCRDQS
jgi:electron transfer flavoprotein alpha subunit